MIVVVARMVAQGPDIVCNDGARLKVPPHRDESGNRRSPITMAATFAPDTMAFVVCLVVIVVLVGCAMNMSNGYVTLKYPRQIATAKSVAQQGKNVGSIASAPLVVFLCKS